MVLHTKYLLINIVRPVLMVLGFVAARYQGNRFMEVVALTCFCFAVVYLVVETLLNLTERLPPSSYLPTFIDLVMTGVFFYFTGLNSFFIGAYMYTTAVCSLNLNPRIRHGIFAFVAGSSTHLLLLAGVLAGILPYENFLNRGAEPNIGGLVLCFALGTLVNFSVYKIVFSLSSRNAKLIESLSAEQERNEKLLLNVLPAKVLLELKSSGRYQAKELDNVSVVFIDFVNFTATTKDLSPETIVATLDRYFTEFDGIISRNGCEKLKTLGDGYMYFSGMELTTEGNHAAACKAALEIQAYVKRVRESGEWSPSFDCRIGIATGAVMAGIIGKDKFAFDIWGSTVNMASRLESKAPDGEILICETTARQVHPKLRVLRCKPVELKSFGERAVFVLRN